MKLELRRLAETHIPELLALHNHPKVTKHLPLANHYFSEPECRLWLKTKNQLWQDCGYGPWAFHIDGEFAGWGGLQPENGEPDLALVLLPDYWGYGIKIYKTVIEKAFNDMGFNSITALLPLSRTSLKGMGRLGFREEGQFLHNNHMFVRFRLLSQNCSKARNDR